LIHIGVLCDPESFHTRKWSAALQRNGARVTVFSFSDSQIEGIDCVKIKPAFAPGGRLNYLSFLYSGRRLAEALHAHEVDVANPINITPYGVWAARSGFRPMVSIAMGADILEYPPDPSQSPLATWTNTEQPSRYGKWLNRLKYYFYRHHVSHALQQADLITGDNLELVHAVVNWFGMPGERVKLNRWGVEENLFHPGEERLAELRQKYGIAPGQRVVLSPRGMKPIYQGELILEAFARLLPQQPEVKFIMFSAGYEVSKGVREKAIAMGRKYPNFHYEFGLVPREEVIELWDLVDIFVSAPLYDGYSNAVAEGRYGGAIPVVNAIPGNREIIRHDYNGWMVDPFTLEKLQEALKQLLSELPAYKQRFHQNSLPWLREHSLLDVNVQRFIADCERMVGVKV
jgi:glycosyltransferase involved in cell wall biosynthesis